MAITRNIHGNIPSSGFVDAQNQNKILLESSKKATCMEPAGVCMCRRVCFRQFLEGNEMWLMGC